MALVCRRTWGVKVFARSEVQRWLATLL